MKSVNVKIKASRLIEQISAGDVIPEVKNDEGRYPQLLHVTVSAESGEECVMTAYYYYQEDQPNKGVSLGEIVIEIDGVRFTAARIADGEHDTFTVSGREIEYDNGLTEYDIVAAIEECVDLPEYSPENYEFDVSDITDEDLKNAIEDEPEAYAVKDGVVYGFDSEDDIPDDGEFKPIQSTEAQAMLVAERQNLEFEQWG